MNEQMKMDFDKSVIVPDIAEVKVIPEEELPVFDVDAKDMRFDDEVFLQSEAGDAPEEPTAVDEPSYVAPSTHGIEEAIPGMGEGE